MLGQACRLSSWPPVEQIRDAAPVQPVQRCGPGDSYTFLDTFLRQELLQFARTRLGAARFPRQHCNPFAATQEDGQGSEMGKLNTDCSLQKLVVTSLACLQVASSAARRGPQAVRLRYPRTRINPFAQIISQFLSQSCSRLAP